TRTDTGRPDAPRPTRPAESSPSRRANPPNNSHAARSRKIEVKGCRKAHGSWSFRVDAGIDTDTGKRKQVTRSGFRTRDEAEAELSATLAALNSGMWTDDKGTTVGEWLKQWLEETARMGASPKTLANYRGHVRDLWTPQLGRIKLRDLRRSHIEKAIATLSDPVKDRKVGNAGRRVEKRSPATIDGYRRTVRAALSAAQRRGLITMNPAVGRLDAIPRGATRELSIWQPDQTAAFLEHVHADRLSALYELAAYAGLRRGELCGLRWHDLDGDNLGLRVRQTIVEVSSSQLSREQATCPVCGEFHVGRLFKEPKSRAGRRWVPLATPARDALLKHREAQESERRDFGADYADHDLVFSEVDGIPLRPGSVTAAFEAHVKACGLPVIRLHDSRHGACSLLLAGGVPIDVVQMILGHASPTVTRQVYAHVLRAATVTQVEAASELLTKFRPMSD
ncbi:MAG: site-specific integrase, partial [Actinobacteria bacterium]|nr:site-specific integrase [Actinomycetota bacterium]